MNAFTQKPDLSKFVKEVQKTHTASSHGVIRSARVGGKIVPGTGERNTEKTKIHKRV